MSILGYYLVGVGVAAAFGLIVCLLLGTGLSAVHRSMFPEAAVRRFWSRLVFTVIMLAALSGAMSATYPTEAATDRLVLIWSLMNQWEAMGLRLLWTLLVVFSVLLFAHSFGKREA